MEKFEYEEVKEIYEMLKSIRPELTENLLLCINKNEKYKDLKYDVEVIDKYYDRLLDNMFFGCQKEKVKGIEHYIRNGRFSKVNDTYDDMSIEMIYPCARFYDEIVKYPELIALYGTNKKIVSDAELKKITYRISSLLNKAMIRTLPKYAGLIDEHFKDIIGQDGAKDKIKKLLIRKNLDIAVAPKNKILTMLLTGPTGTGKTQTAKNIAKLMFGSENAMIRIDMNEYRDDEVGVNTLKGMPKGYKDSETKSPFVQFVSTHKAGVILLDEFEKACEPIKNFFFKLIDEGKFEDNQGRKYDLSNYILIATTNAYGRNEEENIFGVKQEASNKSMMQYLNEKLGSALVGRFNTVIEYLPFTQEQAIEIVNLYLKKKLERNVNAVGKSTMSNIRVEYKPSREEFAMHILNKNNEQFKQNGARILISEIDSLWDVVIPELTNLYVDGLSEYGRAIITLEYIDGEIYVKGEVEKYTQEKVSKTNKR